MASNKKAFILSKEDAEKIRGNIRNTITACCETKKLVEIFEARFTDEFQGLCGVSEEQAVFSTLSTQLNSISARLINIEIFFAKNGIL